jgi:hypothetical protein
VIPSDRLTRLNHGKLSHTHPTVSSKAAEFLEQAVLAASAHAPQDLSFSNETTLLPEYSSDLASLDDDDGWTATTIRTSRSLKPSRFTAIAQMAERDDGEVVRPPRNLARAIAGFIPAELKMVTSGGMMRGRPGYKRVDSGSYSQS